ncbi:MAG: LytR C-terminal domain-containing protein [Longimicrobiales bacterium]
MGQRLRGLILITVLLGVGILLGSALSQWRPLSVPGPGYVAPRFSEGRLRVEVLNGGGEAGAARGVTGLLRDLGLDVVYYGNAETFSRDSSVVLDRVGLLEASRKVADALGIREVRSEPDSNLYVDLTVRLGPEWKHPSESVEEDSSPSPWWDFRRFFKKGEAEGNPNSTRP